MLQTLQDISETKCYGLTDGPRENSISRYNKYYTLSLEQNIPMLKQNQHVEVYY